MKFPLHLGHPVSEERAQPFVEPKAQYEPVVQGAATEIPVWFLNGALKARFNPGATLIRFSGVDHFTEVLDLALCGEASYFDLLFTSGALSLDLPEVQVM
ncbi:unnamed protein product [Caretta caretta]